jgi:hypothetical protein
MGTVIRHEQCPQCAKDGHDNSRDNLAIYNDGSTYCFRCGYFTSKNVSQNFESLHGRIAGNQQKLGGICKVPGDVTTDLPEKVWRYLHKYSLTDLDISKNTILWSPSYNRIIFPYFVKGVLQAWQGRDIENTSKAKWWTTGNVKDLFYLLGNPYTETIVIVEDIISAIRVGNSPNVCSMPLFGSIISTRQLLILKDRYKTIKIWLDKDKELYSKQVSKKAREFGIDASSIVTDQDPKEYSDTEIEKFLHT